MADFQERMVEITILKIFEQVIIGNTAYNHTKALILPITITVEIGILSFLFKQCLVIEQVFILFPGICRK
ncbi:MAG: hypothetical protein A2338_09565 [Bacteroidetes bacterium RIFOXYB12_FULL_41_6]|nr:MAG: hypothetical protein A2338_09565 [Bacteroidetes bacterium RIFOXYB12_FULL_41_6]